MSVFYRCAALGVPVVCDRLSAIVFCGYFRFEMSDLFEKKLFLSPAARRRGGKAGFALGRILSVIFFVIALGMFFGGLFFWLQKRQASLDSGAAARICATPEMLSGELKAALKDRVDYSFWPPYHISPMEKQDLLQLPGGGTEISERRGCGAKILFCVEVPAIASFNGQALRHVSA